MDGLGTHHSGDHSITVSEPFSSPVKLQKQRGRRWVVNVFVYFTTARLTVNQFPSCDFWSHFRFSCANWYWVLLSKAWSKGHDTHSKSASRTGQWFLCPGNSCLKGPLASWSTSDRPKQLLLIWFLICSWIFTFQRCRDLDSDPSSLVLGSWLKPWMEGPIFLVFLLKQGLQKMIHPEFWFTLWSASLPPEGAGPCTFAWERCPHLHTTQLPRSLPPPRQPDSIPQNLLPFQPCKSCSVISQVSSKLCSLALSDNISTFSLPRSRKKRSCPAIIVPHFVTTLGSNIWDYCILILDKLHLYLLFLIA